MEKRILLAALALLAITAVFSVSVLAANNLPAIQTTQRNMFKNMLKTYFHPAITGWGIGINQEQDTYLAARFHAVSIKTLARQRIREITQEVINEEDPTWTRLRDRLNQALQDEGETQVKARIKINGVNYIMTGVVKDETTFSGVIRTIPDYDACIAAGTSTEDCELDSEQVGELSLTRKEAEFERGRDRVWAGTLTFEDTEYIFVALVNPPVRAAAAVGATPAAATVAGHKATPVQTGQTGTAGSGGAGQAGTSDEETTTTSTTLAEETTTTTTLAETTTTTTTTVEST